MTVISHSQEISLYLNHSPAAFQRDTRLPKTGEDVDRKGESGNERIGFTRDSSGSARQQHDRVRKLTAPGYLLAYNNKGEGVTAFSTQTAEEAMVDFYA